MAGSGSPPTRAVRRVEWSGGVGHKTSEGRSGLVVMSKRLIRVRRPQGVESEDARRAHVRETLRSSLWFVPILSVLAAAALALVAGAADHRYPGRPSWLSYSGGPTSAQQILTTIAVSMMTFTGLVFTITIVVLQLASSQFSPRVLRSFLRDRGSQLCLGIFTATFVYALLVLVQVRTGSVGPVFVPGLSITIALGLVTASLGAFIFFVNHIAQSIRVVNIIASVAEETHHSIDALWAESPSTDPERELRLSPDPSIVVLDLRGGGVLLGLNVNGLVAIAARQSCVMRLLPKVGDFVANGAPLFAIHDAREPVNADALHRQVDFGRERTMRQDPAFGLRQLVDIASKALSPAVNDPTTAVQAIDRIHDILSHLIKLPESAHHYCDGAGDVRLVRDVVTWPGFVALAFEEIHEYGGASVQVHRRLRASLEELLSIAAPNRREPLLRQMTLVDRAARRHFSEPEEQAMALESDQSGIGGVRD